MSRIIFMSKNRGNNLMLWVRLLLLALLLAFVLSFVTWVDRQNSRGLGGAIGLLIDAPLAHLKSEEVLHRTPNKNLSY